MSSNIDLVQLQEWLESLDSIVKFEGREQAEFILNKLYFYAKQYNLNIECGFNTPYVNTIPVNKQAQLITDEELEKRVCDLIRWNALAMVLRAGRDPLDLGGHIATYASSATLYEVGFNYFFHAPTEQHLGDLVFIQGHSAPGIYARAYLEGRLTSKELECFRQEVGGEGIPSYPHPRSLPFFWQFATVSMGLAPIQAIYQARFDKYLIDRNIIPNTKRKIWAFLGDGEMDEPESLGAIGLAARENLDNLIFIINCNLQRLDGPVRGNYKIIQELERVFIGGGWNVIKVIWGSKWDPLLEKDHKGLLKQRMEECLDGDYQNYWAQDGAYIREHFFGKYPELLQMVSNYSDDEIWQLDRGGHDPKKIYAAFAQAHSAKGKPTVILAKTIKGFGMGFAGEGKNITHQQKHMTMDDLKIFRERFNLPLSDDDLKLVNFYKPDSNSSEIKFIKKQRAKLGGYLPSRTVTAESLVIPKLDVFHPLLEYTGDREFSTTMACVRFLSILLKDPNIGKKVVPIVADEGRSFGMEGLFRQFGIYSHLGQLYTPEDHKNFLYYRETKEGQILQEGITEAGAFCSWLAAATSYSARKQTMIPFYMFYSMFGFQRIGDLIWAAADMRARGILIGCTAGRTTLAGEGIQHTDGHSHMLAANIPSCISYDPAYAYELAIILEHALFRMYSKQEDIFYYVTTMNENYCHPNMPKGCEDGVIKGMYLLKSSSIDSKLQVNLLGSGAILNEVLKAALCLESHFKVKVNVWSVTSFTELKREAIEIEHYNRMELNQPKKQSYVSSCLDKNIPVIAATDYVRAYADQIRSEINNYTVLGTDGFGISDTRDRLRKYFEVDGKSIAYAALYSLFEQGKLSKKALVNAFSQLGLKIDKAALFKL